MTQRTYTLPEIARALLPYGINLSEVRRWAADGRLPTVAPVEGARVRVTGETLGRVLRRLGAPAPTDHTTTQITKPSSPDRPRSSSSKDTEGPHSTERGAPALPPSPMPNSDGD